MRPVLRPTKDRAIVLVSGGLDSVVCAAWAVRQYDEVLGLTFDYGQRAASEELRAAKSVAAKLGFRWMSVALPWLGQLGDSALLNSARPLPVVEATSLNNNAAAQERARVVWVPNRNGVFVAVAGAYADAWLYTDIVIGLNREEGAYFPDNTAEFTATATTLMRYSTLVQARVLSPTVEMTKAEIVQLGVSLGAPLELVWSCYGSGAAHCWECESCRRLRRALEKAGAWPERAPQWGAGT